MILWLILIQQRLITSFSIEVFLFGEQPVLLLEISEALFLAHIFALVGRPYRVHSVALTSTICHPPLRLAARRLFVSKWRWIDFKIFLFFVKKLILLNRLLRSLP